MRLTAMRLTRTLSLGLVPLLGMPAWADPLDTSAGPMEITPVIEGLTEPWGLDFLPDGAFLVTERDGALRLVSGGQAMPVSGLPEVYAQGQGGLLDVLVPSDFAETREVWLSYAAPVEGGAATAVGKGVLSADRTALEGFTPVFTAQTAEGGRHFGARLVEASNGDIYLTTGDRGTGPEGMEAQDGELALGAVIRLSRDGTPVAGREDWLPGVWSKGHRNIQGATLDLQGNLLVVEHGAQGGDELNRPEQGRNYGWPVISYGINYNGDALGEGTEKEGMEQPLHYWDPSIAPSGLLVYSGALVPEWQGDIFTGSLNTDFLSRLDPDTAAETGYAEERLSSPETGRVRDVMEAPDGSIWFISVTEGTVFRLAPG